MTGHPNISFSKSSRPDDRVAGVQDVGGHTLGLAQVEVGVVQLDT